MVTTGEHALRVPASTVAGAALVVCAATLWATFGILARFLYDDGFNPLELASARTAIAFIGILVIALTRLRRVAIPLRAVPFFAAYGIIGFALFSTILLLAIERTSVSVAVALLYTAPIFVVLLSAVIWRERIGPWRVLALVAGFTGVVLVTGAAGSLVHGTAVLSADALLPGLAAGFGYAMFTMFSKAAASRYGPFRSLFWSFLFAALALAIIAPPWPVLGRADADSMLLLIALGIVPTTLPYLLYLLALRRLEASTAAMLASVEPVAAALLAAFILNERLSVGQISGIVLVATSAVLVARQSSSGPDIATGSASGAM